jgi:CDGSH-type Zn-finger protein
MTPTVTVNDRGPLHCPQARVSGAPGAEVWLCRCGGSGNQPHCDGSHRALGFSDPGMPPAGAITAPTGAELSVEVRPHGPLLVTGAVVVADAAGAVVFAGERAALCRCGASANKPFCDGAHKRVGFTAP